MPSGWTNGRSATLTAQALDKAIQLSEAWFRANPDATNHQLHLNWFNNIKQQMLRFGGTVSTKPKFTVRSPAPYSTSWFPSNCG